MSARTRVVILGHTAELGGAELALLRLLDAVRDPLIEVRVVLFSDGPLVGLLRDSGHPVEVLPLDGRVSRQTRHEAGRSLVGLARTVVVLIPFLLRLTRRLRALGVDVIQTNTLKADLVGVPVALLARRPLVWWMHDRIETDYLPTTTVRVVRWMARRFPRVVVANSRATGATLPGVRRLVVAYPGLAPEEIARPRSAHPSDGPPVVGIVGRLSDTKGQLEFVRAAALVASARPDSRFCIVGSAMFGQEEYEARVRDEVHRLGLAGVVEFTGFVADPVAEIDRLSVCVHASGTPEPFGQVITQAMVRGVPVVATRGGGVTEIVEPAGAPVPLGRLVTPGDVPGLARAVLEVLEDPGSARTQAEAARTWAAEHFTIARTADVMAAVWASCTTDV